MEKHVRAVLNLLLVMLLLFTLAFIWGNSAMSSSSSSTLSNSLLERISPVAGRFGVLFKDDLFLRKLAHFAEFFALGLEIAFLSLLNMGKVSRCFIISAGASLGVGVLDECIQIFSGRYARVIDVMLDFSGSLCGIAAACLMFSILKKRIKSSDV